MSLIVSLTPLQPLPPLPEPPEFIPIVPVTPEEPPEEREPWWVDVAQWIGSWLIDNILRPGTEWFISIVEWVVAEIKVFKHNLFLLLAELYETDLGFLFLTVGTILVSVYLPQLIAKIAASSIGAVIKKVYDWVKEGTGRLLEMIGFVNLVAISQIMEAIWPLWRDLMGQLSEAVSALAEELGEGTGYIHAWVSVVHGLVLTSNALLGIEGKASELEAFEATESFLRNVSENFRKYAHDPGLIVRDIIETYYIPYAQRIKDTQGELIESVTTNRDKTLDLYAVLRDFEGRLTHFIGIQPIETAAIVEEKLGPLRDSLGSFLDNFQINILPAIEGTLSALERRADWIEAANASAAEKIDDPLYTLAMYDLMTPAEQFLFNRGVMLIAAAGEETEIEATVPAFDALSEVMIEATKDRYIEAPPVIQPPRPALSFEMPGSPSVGAIPGWYQGEY